MPYGQEMKMQSGEMAQQLTEVTLPLAWFGSK